MSDSEAEDEDWSKPQESETEKCSKNMFSVTRL